MLELVIYGIVGVLSAFIAVGAVTLIESIRRARKAARAQEGERGRSVAHEPAAADIRSPGVAAALHRYVGPVGPEHRFFNIPVRVAMEFGSSLLGFPGLGWLMSGKVITGIVLFIAGPGAFYAFLPAYFVTSGRLGNDPFVIARMLPVVAVLSASALALHQTGLLPGLRKHGIESD